MDKTDFHGRDSRLHKLPFEHLISQTSSGGSFLFCLTLLYSHVKMNNSGALLRFFFQKSKSINQVINLALANLYDHAYHEWLKRLKANVSQENRVLCHV